MKLRLDCEAMSRLISESQELTLPAAERARMRLHFVICEACRNVNEQMEFLRHAMRRMDKGADKNSDKNPDR